jgi:iron only hydrogenase large subunit-like protein
MSMKTRLVSTLLLPPTQNCFEEAAGKYYITANCPAIVKMIERHHPDLTQPCPSGIANGSNLNGYQRYTQRRYCTVFIGPCIDAKDEALLYRMINSLMQVLTFIELRQMFDEA